MKLERANTSPSGCKMAVVIESVISDVTTASPINMAAKTRDGKISDKKICPRFKDI